MPTAAPGAAHAPPVPSSATSLPDLHDLLADGRNLARGCGPGRLGTGERVVTTAATRGGSCGGRSYRGTDSAAPRSRRAAAQQNAGCSRDRRRPPGAAPGHTATSGRLPALRAADTPATPRPRRPGRRRRRARGWPHAAAHR